MKSKIAISIFIFTLALLSAACSDSPFSPPGETNPPPGSKTTFGLVEVTISGIGTENMAASAKPAEPATAFSFTDPQNADNSGDGSIQMEAISNGSFTTGTRGVDGMRYIYATFKVRNAEIGGDNYDTPRENLTFMAVDDGTTLGLTAVVALRLFDGTLITNPQATNIAKTIIPTSNVANRGGEVVPLKVDVLQILTETETTAIPAPVGVDVFPYGFVTSSPNVTLGSRKLLPFAVTNQYDGIVTFAFKMPLLAQANQDPFEITILFLPVDDSEVRLTQSLEEQTPEGIAAIEERAAELNALYVSLLPGNLLTAVVPVRRLCGPVRIAGSPPPAAPTAVLFPAPPVFVGLNPNPYGGSGHKISSMAAISATYDKPVQAANSNTFVVHGGQSGRLFTGGGYTNAGTTVMAQAAAFFPGELVEVTLTPGLGSCKPTVARYRVAAAAGGGAYTQTTVSVGDGPRGVTAGDWNGDADLDLAVANLGDDNISLLTNNGSGAFTESTVSVGDSPASVTSGDWDGDGDLDLAVSNLNDDNVILLAGDGAGAFTVQSTLAVGDFPISITSGDLNGDGDLDLAVVNFNDDNVSLLTNNGAGSFTESTVSVGDSPSSVASGDWDGDGYLDLAVGNGKDDNLSLLMNDGSGAFSKTTVMVGDGPRAVTAGDWEGDGDLDLAVINKHNDNVSLLANNGSGAFSETTDVVGDEPISIIAGDWDGDGDLDLAVANALDMDVTLLEGNGDGTFTPAPVTVSVTSNPYKITAGDWDSDGDLDFALTIALGLSSVNLLDN